MIWVSSYSGGLTTPNFHWNYLSSPDRFKRDTGVAPNTNSILSGYDDGYFKFKSNKTYIWKTHVKEFNSLDVKPFSKGVGTYPYRNLKISPPYKPSATFSYSFKGGLLSLQVNAYTLPLSAETENTLIFIDSPKTDTSIRVKVNYGADLDGFGDSINTQPELLNTTLIELDWLIQGYSFATSSNAARDRKYEGWRYIESDNSFSFQHSDNNLNERRLPISLNTEVLSGNLNTNAVATYNQITNTYTGVTFSNFICQYIDSEYFNLQLKVLAPGSYIDGYLFDSLPPITTNFETFKNFLNSGQKIARFENTADYDLFNLTGNKYLVFVSEYKNVNLPYTNKIEKLKIIKGYSQTDNNEQFLLTNSDLYYEPTNLSAIGLSDYSTFSVSTTTNQTAHDLSGEIFGLTGATGSFGGFFSTEFAGVINLSRIFSKIGNGKFKSGIWENGVWNSGLRIDNDIHEFDDVQIGIKMTSQNIKWRIQIVGSTFSTSNFEIGDKVAISNIVAIDINEQRKLLKNYFTIVNKTDTLLIIETDNNFPIRRIQKDSDKHKILVTKNIWLNGGFLNGYFEGVWNDGLFRGYPYITEMYNSHWIDGTFNGGHFYSRNQFLFFEDTFFTNGSVGFTVGNGGTAHGLLPGDKIIVDKFDKTINPTYDGEWKVISVVNDEEFITDIPWGANSTLENGIIRLKTNTGLVQKFKFFDNNVAPKNSKTSTTPKEIWRYNSWMDLSYNTQSSTNIGSNKILFNSSSNNINEVLENHKFGFGDYTALNLYGYITEDVLSSESQFRDIDSFFKRYYSLGTKYEIYQDFLGDISSFNNPFDTEEEFGNLDNFYADGWTYSFSGIQATFSAINRYIKSRNPAIDLTSYHKITIGASFIPGIPSGVNDLSSPTWVPLPFNVPGEDDFNGQLTEYSPNTEWEIGTSGIYDLKINLPTIFESQVFAPGILGLIDDDYIYMTSNVLVGQVRLIKIDATTNSQVVLVNKTIKTTGGNYNVGTVTGAEGADVLSIAKSLVINIDWKGELKENDRIRVEFQKCNTKISNYNSAGPWRGSGFDSDLGVILGVHLNTTLLGISTNDHFTEVKANWRILPGSSITFLNSGVNTSLGFKMKRTSNKTFQYESDKEISFFTLNNENINIEKNRYSMIQFDVIRQPDSILNILDYGTQSFMMQFHTIDLYNFTNFISDEFVYGPTHSFPAGFDPLVEPFNDALSVYANGIDYKYLGKTTVTEYFYNRPGLDLGLWNFNTAFTDNTTTKVHELDNIKFFEVDMIPFFQYTTEDYINKQIQVPLIGVAPVIDYSDENFSFVSSIQIALDGISVDSNGNLTSGAAVSFITVAGENTAATE